MGTDYDLVVIGGGAGGLTAAGMAALLGARTALVERDRLGGECTWTGCVPSKSLLAAASVAQTVRTASRFGFEPVEPRLSFERVMERLRAVQQRIYEDADAPPNMEKLGVEVIEGTASFIDPHTIAVGERTIRSRFFIIAAGSAPRRLALEAPVLTNESVFGLTEQPRHLVIVGAGPVGTELAQAFRRLGSDVTVIAAGPEILPRDDRELASLLRQHLEAEGIRFVLNARATAASQAGLASRIALSNGGAVEGDAVLSAIGREVDTRPLRLDRSGVQAGDKGINIDRRCRTSRRHIYAVGDVTGHQPFTHTAEHMAKVAVTNCILGWPASLEPVIPWCTYTSPELAHTGLATDGADVSGSIILRYPFRQTDRAVIAGETDGLVKVRVDGRGRVLGASILGPAAGELINIWSLAARKRLRAEDVSATIHPYPTLSLANRKAADRWSERWLDSSLLRLLGQVRRYRGVRRGSRALE